MLGNFYNSFKNNNNYQLPQVVLDIISKNLPENYGYVYDEHQKRYIATPIDKDEPQTINISFDSKQISDFPSWAKENPNSMMEYLYRTQTKLKISKAELKCKDGKSYPFAELHKDPFSSKEDIVEEYIFPSPFPAGNAISFETESGKKKDIIIQRVPCDSREYIKMSNIDFPALSLIAFIPDVGCKKQGKISISATPSKAENVFDAVFSLEILKGYLDGSLKINGVTIGKVLPVDPNYDEKSMEDKLNYWNRVLSLQEKTGAKFNPQIKLDPDEIRIFEELSLMFIDGKDISHKAPVEYITVNKDAVEDPSFKKAAIDENNGLALSFINGPEKISLMGTKIKLYTTSLLMGFKIDRVETTEDKARLYIDNASEEPWKLIQRYSLTKSQAKAEQKRMQKTYLI
jgi:hypothetical protein